MCVETHQDPFDMPSQLLFNLTSHSCPVSSWKASRRKFLNVPAVFVWALTLWPVLFPSKCRYGKVPWHSRLQTFVCFIVLGLISYSLCLSGVHLINSAGHSCFRQLWRAYELSCEDNQTHYLLFFCEHRLTCNDFPLLSDELEDLMTSQMCIASIQEHTHLISGEKNLLWLFSHQ